MVYPNELYIGAVVMCTCLHCPVDSSVYLYCPSDSFAHVLCLEHGLILHVHKHGNKLTLINLNTL